MLSFLPSLMVKNVLKHLNPHNLWGCLFPLHYQVGSDVRFLGSGITGIKAQED